MADHDTVKIIEVNVGVGSLSTGWNQRQVQSCPQCPVRDGRPEEGGLSRWAKSDNFPVASVNGSDVPKQTKPPV
jgi:hypothetical protein